MPVLFVLTISHMLCTSVYNHFCVIRVPLVPASLLACHWMCDSPRTGYDDLQPYICGANKRRLKPIYMQRLWVFRNELCMPTRQLTGPLQKSSPLVQTSGYATDCGGAALFDSPRGGTPPCRVPAYSSKHKHAFVSEWMQECKKSVVVSTLKQSWQTDKDFSWTKILILYISSRCTLRKKERLFCTRKVY